MKLVEELIYKFIDENVRKQIQNINILSKKKRTREEDVFLTTSIRDLIKSDPKSIPLLKGAIKRLRINLEEL